MKTAHPRAARVLVRWTFQYGSDRLTCRVDRPSANSPYQLAIVPNDRERCALVETFASPLTALRRHAEIASHLRERGWTVVGYSATYPREIDRPAA